MNEKLSPLIIAGMHRSNTSLLGKAFFEKNFFLGKKLIDPDSPNPEGYFEDQFIVDLEDQMLEDNKDVIQSAYAFSVKQAGLLKVNESRYNQKAIKYFKENYHDKLLYGWKSPRSILFLDYWKKLLPNSKFLFIFRKGDLVASSYVRRGDMNKFTPINTKYLFKKIKVKKALQVWNTYNELILTFINKYKEDCILVELPDLLYSDEKINNLNSKLKDFGVDIDLTFGNDVVNRKLLKNKAEKIYVEEFEKANKPFKGTYEKLKELSI